MAFPPFGNSDHVFVSVSLDFPINSKQDAPFHHVSYDYLGWLGLFELLGLHDHLRYSMEDIPCKDIFKLSVCATMVLVNFMSGCRLELMYILLIISIRSNLTYLDGFQQLVLLPEFIEITFYCLYQQNKSSASKVKFRQVSNCWKMVLEAAKLACATKTKRSSLPRNLAHRTFGKLPVVSGFYPSTFVYSRFCSKIQFLYRLLSSLSLWGAPIMVGTKEKVLGLQIARNVFLKLFLYSFFLTLSFLGILEF